MLSTCSTVVVVQSMFVSHVIPVNLILSYLSYLTKDYKSIKNSDFYCPLISSLLSPDWGFLLPRWEVASSRPGWGSSSRARPAGCPRGWWSTRGWWGTAATWTTRSSWHAWPSSTTCEGNTTQRNPLSCTQLLSNANTLTWEGCWFDTRAPPPS